MRYERKYRIEDSSYDRVLHEVLCNPVSFASAFPDRIVNSIYYDDIDYTSYNDNLLGISNRIKYRIRWYGTDLSAVKKPTLEKKIKKNLLGTKELRRLKDFTLNEGAPTLDLLRNNDLSPYVIVRYHRTYLISMNGLIRATIDQNLEYINMINGRPSNFSQYDKALILEIKYGNSNESIAKLCTNAIPYRMTKNSKYVSAMRLFLQ